MPDTSGLMITAVLNTKISEFEKKIPNMSGLVTTTLLNAKISEVQNKIPNRDKCRTKSPHLNVMILFSNDNTWLKYHGIQIL